MDNCSAEERAHETHRAQANRVELARRIARAIGDDGRREALDGVYLIRSSAPIGPVYSAFAPSLCVIAQGSKEVFVGTDCYQYDPTHYLLTTVELPVVSHIHGASPEHPYLGIRVELDLTVVSSVVMEASVLSVVRPDTVQAIDVGRLDEGLLDAVLRLIRLIESPADAPILAPLVKREMIYRLLVGAQSAQLRHLVGSAGAHHWIARAVDLLRRDLMRPVRMEQVAKELGMSISGFHHQFKAMTAISPQQFQKRLRLQEARRLMLGEHVNAAQAGVRVGYDDAAHFSREYKSLFGVPPVRDVARVRQAASQKTVHESGGASDHTSF